MSYRHTLVYPLDAVASFFRIDTSSLVSIFILTGAILLLAFLTNPGDASFKAFVTELAFRKHLARLNVPSSPTPNAVDLPSKRQRWKPSTGFHFSSRVQLSLRTPAHVFKSFYWFTVVVVTPSGDHSKEASGPMSLEGTWYVGAFGHWWVGGGLDFGRSTRKRIESGEDVSGSYLCRAGLVAVRCLDRFLGSEDNNRSTSKQNIQSTQPQIKRRRSVISKPSEEPAQRTSTPPPLPKSASLPFHRPATLERVRLPAPTPQLKHTASSHLLLLDTHPAIQDTLKDIRGASSNLSDAKSQLATFHNVASLTTHGLHQTLAEWKDRKHADDASKAEFKVLMKNAEESRQTAELAKKGVERRLKGVRDQHELAIRRVSSLEQELSEMQTQMADDESRVLKSGIEASANESEKTKLINHRRKELDLASDTASALGKRVSELEEAIEKAKIKLEKRKNEAQERIRFHQRRQNRLSSGSGSSGHGHYVGQPGIIPIQPSMFRPPSFNTSSQGSFGSPSPTSRLGLLQRRNIPPTSEPEPLQIRTQPTPTPNPNAMMLRPRAMSLSGAMGNLGVMVDTTAPGVIGQGYAAQQPMQKNNSNSSTPPRFFFSRRKAQQKKSTFSPFADADNDTVDSMNLSTGGIQDDTTSMSTFATSLLPSSLVESMDSEGAGGYSPNGSYTDLPHGGFEYPYGYSPYSRKDSWPRYDFDSPPGEGNMSGGFGSSSSEGIPLETVDEDKASKYRRWFPMFINSQAAQLAVFPNKGEQQQQQQQHGQHVANGKKSGLNPDAKVFSFNKHRPSEMPLPEEHPSFASRMYGSLMHPLRPPVEEPVPRDPSTPTGNFFSSLLAFAPSPAERQALQRGLEKSSRTEEAGSKEFLPISSFHSSNVDLDLVPPPHSMASAAWDREEENRILPTAVANPVKRTFSSLWLRNKAARASTSSLTEDKEAPVPVDLPPVESQSQPQPQPVFGGRFGRFGRKADVPVKPES